jgi:hypothetical protein
MNNHNNIIINVVTYWYGLLSPEDSRFPNVLVAVLYPMEFHLPKVINIQPQTSTKFNAEHVIYACKLIML